MHKKRAKNEFDFINFLILLSYKYSFISNLKERIRTLFMRCKHHHKCFAHVNSSTFTVPFLGCCIFSIEHLAWLNVGFKTRQSPTDEI